MTRVRFRGASASLVPVLSAVVVAAAAVSPAPVRADVVGRLRFSVKNAADEKPLAGATITLRDSANVRPDVTVTTDASGNGLTPPLENRAWAVVTKANLFESDIRTVTVAADTTTDVEVLLEPQKETVITVRSARQLVRTDATASATVRDRAFLNRIPATGANNQSLTKALQTNPGFVQDSVNQAHPRGEHSSTSIYINGFLLPGALQGRAGQFLSPDTIQTLDVQTGGYAPEYGGETAAVLNLTLRSGTLTPFVDAQLGGGGFGTFQGSLSFGGQAGAPLGETGTARRIGYLVNLSQRNTDNAIEPPQPNNQSAHNGQTSTMAFGNFTYQLNPTDQLAFIVNTAPARTEVANRTGLPNRFAPYGQGFGYAGALSAEDAAAQGIVSQEAAGQDIYQKDNNTFTALQYRRTFSQNLNAFFTLGYSKSKLDILNKNPNNGSLVNPANLPDDSSIEYSPTIKRDYDQTQIQGTFTYNAGRAHTVKFGGLYSRQKGDESYQLIPGSQAALNALYSIDPRLVPGGGIEGTAADGNPIYTLAGPSQTPTLSVDRSGYYAAAFAQDTFKPVKWFTVNYGLRLDSYQQSQNLGQDKVNQTELSPRVNTAFVVAPLTVLRLSYNRLFTQPPLAQGAILGTSIKPQLSHLFEESVERQFRNNQTAKLAFYQKENRNQLDTGLLVEGTQIGAYTAVNLGKSTVRGVELSYDIAPRNNVGWGGYATWANVTAKPRGLNNLGEVIDDAYNDHDQLNTVGAGLSYSLKNGANAGFNFYYGSGLASSVLEEGGKRQDRTQVDFRLSSGSLNRVGSGPNAKTLGLDLTVENLFDSREVINFQSAFSGTRFQQGRRLLLSVNGKF